MNSLAAGARSLLHLDLSPAQLAAFQTYAEELRAWNERFNLTAVTDLEGIQIKHFLDSLSVLKVLGSAQPAAVEGERLRLSDTAPRPASLEQRFKLIDIGTGAGFPGLPLKIVCPQLQLTLVEATGKKARFCEHIAERLKLSGVRVVHARAEEVGRDPAHREQYDWAAARAVAEMPTLAEYLLPLVKLGGHTVAQKGESAPGEAQGAEAAARRLGGELTQLVPVELPGVVETRYLVVFRKAAATPPAYPRRAGIPSKKPLN